MLFYEISWKGNMVFFFLVKETMEDPTIKMHLRIYLFIYLMQKSYSNTHNKYKG